MQTLALLSVKIPTALKERLEKAAKEEGRTVSSFTRFYLDKKLSGKPAKKGGRK